MLIVSRIKVTGDLVLVGRKTPVLECYQCAAWSEGEALLPGEASRILIPGAGRVMGPVRFAAEPGVCTDLPIYCLL